MVMVVPTLLEVGEMDVMCGAADTDDEKDLERDEEVNVAVSDWFDDMVTVHPPIPVHAPDHPANVPDSSLAIRGTRVPAR